MNKKPHFVSKDFENYTRGIPIEECFGDFCKRNNLHHCVSDEMKEEYYGESPAIIVCYEDEAGNLWAGNDFDTHCESIINYCPFCGYKSK